MKHRTSLLLSGSTAYKYAGPSQHWAHHACKIPNKWSSHSPRKSCTGVVIAPVGVWIAKPNTSLFVWRLEFSQLTPFIYTAMHARELNYFLHVQFRTRVKYRKTVVVRVTGCDPKSANSIRTWPQKKTYVRNLPLSHDTVQNTRTSPTSQPKKITKPKTQNPNTFSEPYHLPT